jgi:hypothetical protein
MSQFFGLSIEVRIVFQNLEASILRTCSVSVKMRVLSVKALNGCRETKFSFRTNYSVANRHVKRFAEN